MSVTATELRKNLFQLAEKSIAGETVEFTHKGRTIRLVPQERSSKLANLTSRPLIAVANLEDQMTNQSKELMANWEGQWSKR